MVLRVRFDEPAIDWSTILPCDDGGVPSLDVGQQANCRVATDSIDGLHVHSFGDYAELHLDAVDGRRDPVGHLISDTHVVPGGLLGLAVGLVAAWAKPMHAGKLVLSATVAGAAIGGFSAKRGIRCVYTLVQALALLPPTQTLTLVPNQALTGGAASA